MTQDRDLLMTDETVSRTYRELATEKTPPPLDAKILAAARAETRTRYGLLRTRTRPLAWAAMIGLSLVIVLQITRLPGGEDALPTETPMPAALQDNGVAEPMPVVTMEAGAAATAAETPPAPAATAAETPPAPAAARGKPGLAEAERADAPERDAVAAEQRQRAPLAAQASAIAPGLSEALSPQGAAQKEALAVPAGSACSESARAAPESWLACIEALRAGGETAGADAEYELLRAAFPDFRIDEPHK